MCAEFTLRDSVSFEGQVRPQYLATGTSSYDPNSANAIELQVRIPGGSPLLAAAGPATLSFFHLSMKPGDPWIGPNAGGNLTDSAMRGRAHLRFDPAAAGRWVRVVLAPGALGMRSYYANMYAAHALSEDLGPFASLRAFSLEPKITVSASDTIAIDDLKLVTLTPTAQVCPAFTRREVPAAGGDVRVPIELSNPGPTPRQYRAFLSSFLGADRQVLETVIHDVDDASAPNALAQAIEADGGLGAVELFASDAIGAPTGPNVVTAGGPGIEIAAGQTWHGVIVHHLTPAMLGPPKNFSFKDRTFPVRRDTLTTSVIFWDPKEPRLSDAAVVAANDHPDLGRRPPGFGAAPVLASGWGSADIPIDQVGAHYVSVLTLTP